MMKQIALASIALLGVDALSTSKQLQYVDDAMKSAGGEHVDAGAPVQKAKEHAKTPYNDESEKFEKAKSEVKEQIRNFASAK